MRKKYKIHYVKERGRERKKEEGERSYLVFLVLVIELCTQSASNWSFKQILIKARPFP